MIFTEQVNVVLPGDTDQWGLDSGYRDQSVQAFSISNDPTAKLTHDLLHVMNCLSAHRFKCQIIYYVLRRGSYPVPEVPEVLRLSSANGQVSVVLPGDTDQSGLYSGYRDPYVQVFFPSTDSSGSGLFPRLILADRQRKVFCNE